jgi:DNA-binding transcriptional ArsR family regulator
MTVTDPGPVLTALAEPTRRELLELLGRHGEATASWLATSLPVSRQAIVKHLAVLDGAGLVAGRRRGREVLYQNRPDALIDTARWMTDLAVNWERRLEAIKHIAESPASE